MILDQLSFYEYINSYANIFKSDQLYPPLSCYIMIMIHASVEDHWMMGQERSIFFTSSARKEVKQNFLEESYIQPEVYQLKQLSCWENPLCVSTEFEHDLVKLKLAINITNNCKERNYIWTGFPLYSLTIVTQEYWNKVQSLCMYYSANTYLKMLKHSRIIGPKHGGACVPLVHLMMEHVLLSKISPAMLGKYSRRVNGAWIFLLGGTILFLVHGGWDGFGEQHQLPLYFVLCWN